MSTLVRSLVFCAVIAGLLAATSLNTPAPAQGKGNNVQPAEPPGTVEVYTDKGGKWRYRVKIGGKSLAIGTVGYKTKDECLKVLNSVRNTLVNGKVVELK